MAAFLPCKLVQNHAAFLPSYASMTVRKPIWACTPHERRKAESSAPIKGNRILSLADAGK